MSVDRLIVGLGNPGADYALTRHNVGFRCLDELAARLDVGWGQESSAQCLAARATVNEGNYLLAKPLTFMNSSGRAVKELIQKYELAPESVLVVYDDLDLPLGALRLRTRGSAGTHNGMRSVVREAGTESMARLRVGIGAAAATPVVEYVLTPFGAEEEQTIEQAVQRASNAILLWARGAVEEAMNTYNR